MKNMGYKTQADKQQAQLSKVQTVTFHSTCSQSFLSQRLSCFERVELNLSWIISNLEAGITWSAIAEILQMSPVTLVRHFDRLTAYAE